MWQAIRYRRAQALVVAALAALITACAVFAPLYDRALQQAMVRVRLGQEPVQVTGIRLTSAEDQAPKDVLSVESLERLVPRDLGRYVGASVPSTTVQLTVSPGKAGSPTGVMMWRAGMCRHVRFASGTCPTARNEVAVSTADAKHFGWHAGSRIPVDERLNFTPDGPTPHKTMTVTGVYSLLPGDYWYGMAVTGISGAPDPDTGQPTFDDWLTARATMRGEPATPGPTGPNSSWMARANEVDLPLHRAAVGVDELLRIGPEVNRFQTAPLALATPPPDDFVAPTVSVYSGLPGIAADVQHGRDHANVIVPLLMVQLGLLSVVVLWLVLGAAIEQRRPEVALARLRGLGVSGARRLLLREIGPVVLAGVPVGTAVAVGLSVVARYVWLPGGVPFELGEGFLLALVVAVGVVSLTVLAAVRPVSREPVSALLRRVPTRRAGWGMGMADALVVAAAGAAVVAFATGGLSGPIALAAPSLLALAVGLVLAHLLVPIAAGAGRGLLRRGHVGAGLSALQVARRPATRRVVAVVTIATALLVFSADALVIGQRNRAYRAERENGAALVATLATTDLAGVHAALGALDPQGAQLTPVVQVSPPGTGGTTTEAVLPGQFRRIALFPGKDPSAIPWGRIAPPDVPPLHLKGRTLSFRLASTRADQPGRGAVPPAQLRLRLVDADGRATSATLGTVPAGDTPAHALHLAVPCARGCLVTGLALEFETGQPSVGGTLTLSGLATPVQPSVPLGPPSQWRGSEDEGGQGMSAAKGSAPGLTVSFYDLDAPELVLAHASVPARVPALVAGSLPAGATGNRFDGLGLDGVTREMTRVGAIPFAPGAPPDTSIVNLEVLERDGATPETLSTVQVWFAHDDPALLQRITKALEQQGIAVSRTSGADGALKTYDQSASAWSLQLALVVGAAALLVAALVMVVVVATSWRLRARDYASLRMAGLPRRLVTAVSVGEQLPVVALAVLVGAACGVVGAHFAMPTVPLFATPPAVSTLDLATAWGPVLAATASALVLLGVVGLWAGRWLARRAAVARVRESL